MTHVLENVGGISRSTLVVINDEDLPDLAVAPGRKDGSYYENSNDINVSRGKAKDSFESPVDPPTDDDIEDDDSPPATEHRKKGKKKTTIVEVEQTTWLHSTCSSAKREIRVLFKTLIAELVQGMQSWR